MILGNTHYRLWGIEAPGLHQTCAEKWPAGERARNLLQRLTTGRHVTCEARGLDPYRRVVGLCRAGGNDLAASMVDAGFAWAQPGTSAYARIEQDARADARGVHGQDCGPPSPTP